MVLFSAAAASGPSISAAAAMKLGAFGFAGSGTTTTTTTTTGFASSTNSHGIKAFLTDPSSTSNSNVATGNFCSSNEAASSRPNNSSNLLPSPPSFLSRCQDRGMNIYPSSAGLSLALTHMGNMVEGGGGGGGRVIDPCSRAMSSPAEMQDHMQMSVMKMGGSSIAAAAVKDSNNTASMAHSAAHNNDTEYESRSGSDNLEGGGSGDELLQDAEAQARPSKKRYHRHAPSVIQELESFFKECPHPDEKQRQDLSRRLNLATRQVKFWFQNRRTQMKAQQERHENNVLRQENERLRAENFSMREALRNASCPTCGGGPTAIDMSIEEQQIRFENARMREELERLYSLGGRMYGAGKSSFSAPIINPTPSSTLPYFQALPTVNSSITSELPLNFNMAMVPTSHNMGMSSSVFQSGLSSGRSDPHLLLHPTSSTDNQHHRQSFLTSTEKSLISELAVVAMEEFVKMVHASDPLWVMSVEGSSRRETLDFVEYLHQFPRGIGPKPDGYRSEATRDAGMVMLDAQTIVDSFFDVNKWMEMFPCIICKGDVGEVISPGSPGTRNGALQLMYAELQVPTPMVPTRQLYFLRYCKTFADGMSAIVDVSVDNLRGDSPSIVNRYRRRPSGCLIQQLPNGFSKVSWVEHSEFDDTAYHHLYRPMVISGMAFGAHRWLSTLKRQCGRQSILMGSTMPPHQGMTPHIGSEEASKMGLLKLAQRMTAQLCSSLSASSTWTTLSGSCNGEDEVRVMTREYSSLNQMSPVSSNAMNSQGGYDQLSSNSAAGIVLSAATSIWLPASPQRVFEFLTTSRREWDVLSVNGPMDELLNVPTGHDPGNYVSLMKPTKSTGSTLIFQECCSDASGASLVYAPVDIQYMDAAMSGVATGSSESPNFLTVPSGFIVMPDGPPRVNDTEIDTKHLGLSNSSNNASSSASGGSLVTVAFQIHVNSLPKSKLTLESISTVNTLVCNTVSNIKKALLRGSSSSNANMSGGDMCTEDTPQPSSTVHLSSV